jgi:sporulation protein YlmC with PRC-barrel domain
MAKETGAASIPATKVNGTAVYNPTGDRLGEIDDVMIEKRSGHVVFAVMSFGGLLGIGEKFHPLPWEVLKYDTNKDGYVVNLDKDALKKAPSYSRDEIGSDLAWRSKVSSYYSATPYWER